MSTLYGAAPARTSVLRRVRGAIVLLLVLVMGLAFGPVPANADVDVDLQNARLCLQKAAGTVSFSSTSLVWGDSVTATWSVNMVCNNSTNLHLAGFYLDGRTDFQINQFRVLNQTNGSVVVSPVGGGEDDSAVMRWRLWIENNAGQKDLATTDLTIAQYRPDPLPDGQRDVTITANTVDQRRLFVRATRSPNATVRIANDVNLDLGGLVYSRIATGVKILGDVSGLTSGPRLFTRTFPRVLLTVGDAQPSDNVRIDGVRFDGGEPDDPCLSADGAGDEDAISIVSSQNVEIDHSEFTKWRGSAIHVHDHDGDGPDHDRLNQNNKGSVWLHDNYFHDNQHPTTCDLLSLSGHGGGYGAEVSDGAYALIERNVFENNRHAIASNGANGSGYYLYDNLFLHPGIDSVHGPVTSYNHQIDVHGQDTCGHGENYNCGTAGEYMDVARNTVASSDSAAIQLRGVPTDPRGMSVHDNVFYQPHDDALTQTRTGLHDDGGNDFPTNLLPDWRFQRKTCDFDGDGTGDSFWATGATWWYASSRIGGRWTYLARSGAHPGDVIVRDVNGDGYCDATGPGNDVHLGPNGTPLKIYNAYGSPIAMAAYPGPGGGMTIIGTNAADGVYLQSQTSAGALSGWGRLEGAMRSVAADTNADGRVEVFAVDGAGHLFSKWQGTPGGDWSAGWHPWDGELNSIALAHNRNGQLELFGTNDAGAIVHRWRTDTGAWTGWSVIGGQLHAIAADTNADGLIELVGVNFQGQVFHKVQTVANSNAWTEWKQLPGQLSSIAIARNRDGLLEIFGANSQGEDYHSAETTKNSDNWLPLQTFAGSFSQIAAETNSDGRMELFGFDPQGNPVYRLQVTAGSWAGSSWTPAGGLLRPTAMVIPAAPAQVTSQAAESQVGRTVATVRPVVVSNGTQPLAWRVDGLPPGLTMSPQSGAVSGIPTTRGVYAVHTTVTDSSNPPSTLAVTHTWTIDAGDCWTQVRDHIVHPIPDLSSVNIDNYNGCPGNASASASLSVNITHPYIGDLVIDLIAPSGHVYNLRNRVGGGAHDLVATYPLNLSGEPKEGLWRLRITDAVGIDVGQLNEMSLGI